jgi:hypothetical protein
LYTSVIPATQAVEARGSKVQNQPGLHSKTLSRKQNEKPNYNLPTDNSDLKHSLKFQ